MRVTLFIPTYNELEGVKAIMPQVKREWVDEIIVVDNSTDGTKEWLKDHGYNVIDQKRKGTMGAWWDGFDAATGDVIIPFSPDGNSVPEAIPQLIAKMKEGDYDMVIASRYLGPAKSENDNVSTAVANSFLTWLINLVYRAHYTDALGMYRAWKKDLLVRLHFTPQTGLEFNKRGAGMFEPILSIRAAKHKIKIAEIPADEPDDIGKTDSRAHPGWKNRLKGGLLMLFHILRERFRPKNIA